MPTAFTEYSYTLPSHTRKFTIKLRESNILTMAFTEGASGTTYLTIPSGTSYWDSELYTTDHNIVTVYFQSPAAAQTAEIVYWN